MTLALCRLLLLGYLPGALLFRLPIAQRERREALAVEERVFWHVLLSVTWSVSVVLGLAALEQYRFTRLLVVNAVVCLALVAFARARLSYRGHAARGSLTLVLPVALIVLGLWRFFPPSEYVIGGKDPGTYMNEGIQIAQRGSLVIHDPVVAAVPESLRELFLPLAGLADYYGRFMGFFVQDPRTGRVIGQFPHLFPASIAIAYGVDGLTGARRTVGAWALLGLLAVYFAGADLVGRGAAFAATVLVSLNVMEVWFARYPNAELAMQALLFAAILAFARASRDADPFFAPIAAACAGLLMFIRVDALLGVVALLAAAVLTWLVEGRRPRFGFVAPFLICGGIAWLYLSGPMRAYLVLPHVFVVNLPILAMAAATAAALAGAIVLVVLARRHVARARATFTFALVAMVLALAAYAWFVRAAGGRLTEYDAHALRDFTHFYLGRPAYLGPAVLAVALVGFALAVHRHFWRDPALVLTIVVFSLFFFYKIRIVPEHFWAARRFLAVILPGILLFASAAAIGMTLDRRRIGRPIVGMVFLCFVGWQYTVAAAPIMPHVEYAGMIPYLERLAASFGDRDLVLVESRNAGSDTHVLAVPLAYIYARNVLVLSSPVPNKAQLRAFLEDATTHYDRVFFVGGGGTDLLARHIIATPVSGDTVQVPEFESAVVRDADGVPVAAAYPSGVRRKEFDYGIYELRVGTVADGPFVLDVGYRDDLNVLRFNAKETTEGHTIRWTGPQSFVAIPGLTGREREVVLVMHDGGRPAQAPPARVNVFFNEVPLGSVTVTSGFHPYRFAIPADVAANAAMTDDPARLRLVSTVWNPQKLRGGTDNRTLGVMVDRVEVH